MPLYTNLGAKIIKSTRVEALFFLLFCKTAQILTCLNGKSEKVGNYVAGTADKNKVVLLRYGEGRSNSFAYGGERSYLGRRVGGQERGGKFRGGQGTLAGRLRKIEIGPMAQFVQFGERALIVLVVDHSKDDVKTFAALL